MAGIGSDDIVERGKATQFGAGNDAREMGSRSKIATWAIRGWAKYFAGQGLDLNDPSALEKLLGHKPTVAQVLAVRMLQKAVDGNLKAIELSMDSIEGKLAQKIAGEDDNPLVVINRVERVIIDVTNPDS